MQVTGSLVAHERRIFLSSSVSVIQSPDFSSLHKPNSDRIMFGATLGSRLFRDSLLPGFERISIMEADRRVYTG